MFIELGAELGIFNNDTNRTIITILYWDAKDIFWQVLSLACTKNEDVIILAVNLVSQNINNNFSCPCCSLKMGEDK